MTQDAGGGAHAGARDEPNEAAESTDAGASEQDRGAGADAAAQADAGAAMERLRQQAEANHDRFMRVAAELENYRKRASRDVENARRYGVERLATALLPVRDSLEAGLASSEQASVEALLDGQRATLRLLDAAFEQVGIEELDPQGEPFDPAKHEAMTVAPSQTAEPDTVLTVVQKGYAVHDRLLRPARVIVAREPDGDAS